MAEKSTDKSDAAKREEEVLAFWQEREIFEKSKEKDAPNGEFVFYDGPPFATGLPHHGSLLSSIIKDVVPRYKTMRGFHVRRRWGWDTHGLPIENLVEKELGLKTKKDILEIGIAKFNETARSMVLRYVNDWKRYVERIGRWVDYDNSYKTMDNTYIESVWWALKKLWDAGKLYEGRKVLMYCPHCETPLAKAEIAADNTYKDVTETAVTVKFKVKPGQTYGGTVIPENTYFLAWTTTPWTLPGNVALAIKDDISYVRWEENGEFYILAEDRAPEYFKDFDKENSSRCEDALGLKGLEYEPLFDVPDIAQSDKAYKVYEADFVTTDEGTGIVHTAVMYGEDDFELGKKESLPMVQMLNNNATYNGTAPEFVRGQHIKKAGPLIVDDLEKRGLLFESADHTHSYPHCWRCGTALIYNAVSSWFIDIQSVKQRMIEENQKVNWVPAHLRDGRFGKIVESAPDWTISRNRFWASPLPIWKERDGDGVVVVGSLDELKALTKKSGNTYFLMRHGEAVFNTEGLLNADLDVENPLTEKGKVSIRATAENFHEGVDIIVHSPLQRTRETAKMLAGELGIESEQVIEDERLLEVRFGEFEGKSVDEYHSFFEFTRERMIKRPEGGETWNEVKHRLMTLLYELEEKHSGKRIVLVTHNGPIQMLQAGAAGLDIDACSTCIEDNRFDMATGEMRELTFVSLPHNAEYELDFHRPYIDEITLVRDGKEYERIPEVVDCWVESGAMPFAEYHYPFENKETFERRAPGDFIAEYIAQTRTWFYYMHAMGVLLFDRRAFKSVVSTGTILAENGEKISKSKRNYTDPLELIDEYGSDALRLYLMGSPVMQAEDLCFRDEDVREMHNRFIGILWNSYMFYAMYKEQFDGSARAHESTHVLDQWILSRCTQTVQDTTDAMDAYEMPRAVRALRAFVDDYSTWYIRRSRDRIKGGGDDAQNTLAVQHDVLKVLSRLVAPVAPFIAESIWQGLGEEPESVHLAPWPEPDAAPDTALIAAMASAREAVSSILELRSTAGLKVRQPLSSATIRTEPSVRREEILALIADEVNVKAVHADGSISEEAMLDTVLTDELRREGAFREILRKVQGMRKSAGLSPGEEAVLTVTTDTSGEELLTAFEDELKKTCSLRAVAFEKTEGGEKLDLDGFSFSFSLNPASKK